MTSKNRITVNLDADEYQELLAISQQQHISMAWLGRQAIIRLLEQYRQEEPQLALSFPEKRRSAGL